MLPVDVRLPELARVIEAAVVRSIDTDDTIGQILSDAQAEADQLWATA